MNFWLFVDAFTTDNFCMYYFASYFFETSCRSTCAIHRRSVQPFAGSRSLPRGFQEGVHHSDGEEARHGHDRRLIIPTDLEPASAVKTPGMPRRQPAHGLPADRRPAASQPERI